METIPASEWTAGEIRAQLARSRRTQAELADHLGLSNAAVSRRLSGFTPIDVNEIEAIADFLGVPASQLMRAAS